MRLLHTTFILWATLAPYGLFPVLPDLQKHSPLMLRPARIR